MKLPRRRFLQLTAGAAAFSAVSRVARAQAYPTRPVRIIVPFGPAGSTDITARVLGQWLSERLGQQFIIENRPGAGILEPRRSCAPPDGYTLLLVGLNDASNASLYDNLKFNVIRDIAPISGIVRFPNLFVVNPLVPATTVSKFITYAKANPGKINMRRPASGARVMWLERCSR